LREAILVHQNKRRKQNNRPEPKFHGIPPLQISVFSRAETAHPQLRQGLAGTRPEQASSKTRPKRNHCPPRVNDASADIQITAFTAPGLTLRFANFTVNVNMTKVRARTAGSEYGYLSRAAS
jgi:hypothetical protein